MPRSMLDCLLLVLALRTVCFADSSPMPQNCKFAQTFSIDVGARVQFTDIPREAGTCAISATTRPYGGFCAIAKGKDIKLCLGENCHSAGESSPNFSGWEKHRDEKVLTVTNLHHTACSVFVQNFLYCCGSEDATKHDSLAIVGAQHKQRE